MWSWLVIIALVSGCSSSPKNENQDSQTGEIQGIVDDDKPSPVQQPAQASAKISEPGGGGESQVSRPELFKKLKEARVARQNAAAYEIGGEILGRIPNDRTVLNTLAVIAIEEGKYDLARLILNKILTTPLNNKDGDVPPDPSALNNLGVVELKTDNLRLALVNFKRATELDPRNKAAHANLGTIYLQYRNHANAVHELELAYEYGDRNTDTLNNYGVALVGVGQYDKALAMYDKALAQDNRNTNVMLNQAIVLVEHLNDPSRASKILNKLKFVTTDPGILEKVSALARKLDNSKGAQGP